MTSRVSATSSGLSCAFALDGQLDLGVGRAAHLVDRVVQAQPLHGLAVERQDQVARLDAGAAGRRVVDRADHLDEAVVLRHLDAEAAELAAGLHLHVAERLGVHVVAVRVEAGEHAVDGVLDQVAVVHRLDIVGAHPLEHVAEQGQQPVGLGPSAVLRQGVRAGTAGRTAAPESRRRGRSPRRRRRRLPAAGRCEASSKVSSCARAQNLVTVGGISPWTHFNIYPAAGADRKARHLVRSALRPRR